MSILSAWRGSLSLRLAGSILLAQFVLVVLLNLAALLEDKVGSIAGISTFSQFRASVVSDPSGRLVLRPTQSLAEQLRDNPQTHIAAVQLSDLTVLPGSNPAMAQVLDAVRATGLHPANWMSDLVHTPKGDVLMVAHAQDWRWSELPEAMWFYFKICLRNILIMSAALGVVAVVVARLTLRPMHAAALQAERLSLRALDGRLPEAPMPLEVAPFVRSVNAMLDRLDSEVARQRRFIANAAHELRTPLTILAARVDVLAPSAAKVALAADTARITNIVQQLLTAARLGDLALPLDQEIDVASVVRLLVAEHAPIAIERGRDIAFSSSGAVRVLRGNLQAFESAVANVLDNALHAEPVGGVVEVAVTPGPVVTVTDHGCGIAEADLPRIFEPFWRGTGARPGSGLGLAIVQESMRLHRGSIEVRSAPGRGTSVLLRFGASADTTLKVLSEASL